MTIRTIAAIEGTSGMNGRHHLVFSSVFWVQWGANLDVAGFRDIDRSHATMPSPSRETIKRAVAELGKVQPAFLKDIDRDPDSARRSVLLAVYCYLSVSQPRAFGWFDEDRRADLPADVAMTLVKDDFKKLRAYQDRGRRFASWLMTVADNHARDQYRRLRHEIPMDEPPEPKPSRRPHAEMAATIDANRIEGVIGGMDRRCRLLLTASLVRGWSNKETTRLFPGADVDNKKTGTWLHECKRKLLGLLTKSGISADDLIDLATAGGGRR